MTYAHSAQCIIILVLQPGSDLDWPNDVYPLHSVCALVFQLWAPGNYSCWVNSSLSILLASLGVSWQELFYMVREVASFLTTDGWFRPLYFPRRQGGPAVLLDTGYPF